MPACCQEIVLKSKSKKSHAELADLLGVYKYMFDEKRIADIEKGLFDQIQIIMTAACHLVRSLTFCSLESLFFTEKNKVVNRDT